MSNEHGISAAQALRHRLGVARNSREVELQDMQRQAQAAGFDNAGADPRTASAAAQTFKEFTLADNLHGALDLGLKLAARKDATGNVAEAREVLHALRDSLRDVTARRELLEVVGGTFDDRAVEAVAGWVDMLLAHLNELSKSALLDGYTVLRSTSKAAHHRQYQEGGARPAPWSGTVTVDDGAAFLFDHDHGRAVLRALDGVTA